MKRLVVLPLALVLALLLVVPASADAPVVETYTGTDDYMIEYQPCPGIEIWDDESYTLRFTTWFDAEGVPTRIKIHGWGVDSLYNPADPDVRLSKQFVGNLDVDLATGAWVNGRGVPFHITVPGFGTVMVRAGRWTVYPVNHVAGKDSLNDPKDIAQLCSLLAVN